MDAFPAGELRRPPRPEGCNAWACAPVWPDFQIFHADGRACFLELKRPGGRLSPDRQRIADHLRRAGHDFAVVDSVEAAISVLVVWGVVRSGIHVQ